MKKVILTSILLVLTFMFNSVYAETYNIGIKEAPPFATKTDSGWTGLSVVLIDQLSERLGFDYKFIDESNIKNLIDSASTSKNDLALAAITITSDRERMLDFSHPYFSTELGFAVRDSSSIMDNIIWMFNRVLLLLILFIAGLYIVGALIDKIDGDIEITNIHDGAWWALVTFTTTGYGDKVPKTGKGKLFASIWMIISLFLLSMFISYMSSAMVIKKLEAAPPTIHTLYKSNVVSMRNSTSSIALNKLNIDHKLVDSLAEGLEVFEQTNNSVLVYDKAMLDHTFLNREDVTVNSMQQGKEQYAIAFPSNSKLIEQFNVELLNVINSQDWTDANNMLFGK